MSEFAAILAILTGLIIPLAVFIWLYLEGKGKRETILEISKNMDDPARIDDLLGMFDERKKTAYRLSTQRRHHVVRGGLVFSCSVLPQWDLSWRALDCWWAPSVSAPSSQAISTQTLK